MSISSSKRHLVSIIISVYDSYNRTSVLLTVLRRWNEQLVKPEIILSEQASSTPRFEIIASKFGMRYIRSYPDLVNGKVRYNIGRVRNAGICTASGKYLYLTDADVFPLDNEYLYKLISASDANEFGVFYRPKIYRLLEHDIEPFLSHMQLTGGRIKIPRRDFCLASFEGHGIVPAAAGEVRGQYEGWTYVCTPQEFAYLSSKKFDTNKEINLIMKPEVHWGGTFLFRQAAIRVGGYSEKYYDWGFEDEDFHKKLSGFYKLSTIDVRKLIHFEHPRPYNNEFRQNKYNYKKRSMKGIASMIEEDFKNEKSLFALWYRKKPNHLRRYMRVRDL